MIRTYRDEAASKIAGVDVQQSETILRDIRVLAVGQLIQEKNGTNVVTGETATLALSPAQAETVTLAQKIGSLSLSLRSLADAGQAADPAAPPPEGAGQPGPDDRPLRGSPAVDAVSAREAPRAKETPRAMRAQAMPPRAFARSAPRRLGALALAALTALPAGPASAQLRGSQERATLGPAPVVTIGGTEANSSRRVELTAGARSSSTCRGTPRKCSWPTPPSPMRWCGPRARSSSSAWRTAPPPSSSWTPRGARSRPSTSPSPAT